MALSHWSVTLEAGADPFIVLNGEPVDSSVYRFVGVRQDPGSLPALLLEVEGQGTVQGDGVTVIRQQANEIEFLRQWLEALDPQEINRLSALHAPNLSVSTGEGVKAALLEMVNG